MQQLVSLVAQNVGLPSTANRAHKYQFIKVTFIPNYVTVLYCIVLHCIVLYCIVLHCIVLHCIELFCFTLSNLFFSLFSCNKILFSFTFCLSYSCFRTICLIVLIGTHMLFSHFVLSYLIFFEFL